MLHPPSHVHMLDTTYEPQAKQCVTSGCTRNSWNGQPGGACCRNCPHPEGGTHDAQCEIQADFSKLWEDRFKACKEYMLWVRSYPRLSLCSPITPCNFGGVLKTQDFTLRYSLLRYSLRQPSVGHSRFYSRGCKSRTCAAFILNDIARFLKQRFVGGFVESGRFPLCELGKLKGPWFV